MPILDFAHPLKTFTVNDSYTTTTDCYLYIARFGGSTPAYGKGATNLKIDNKVVCYGIGDDPVQSQGITIKLTSGQVITTDGYYGNSVVYILNEL